MNMIYELKHKKRFVLLDILMIIGFAMGIVVFTFIMYLLKELTGFQYMYYVEFVLLIVFAVWFSKRKLIEFTYYLDGDILRIDRIYSKRPKMDLFIRMDKVVFMGKYKNLPEPYRKYKIQRETFMRIVDNSFCVVYAIENKYFTAVLSPSEEFEQGMIKAWKDYTNKPKKDRK